MVHFYDLETLDLIGSPMQVGDHVHSVAYTRDGKWLATVSRTKGRWNLSFWQLEGESPFDSVVMRFPFSGSGIYPYGERGIVHQQGDQIMVLELPKPCGDLRSAELKTRVDTGLRQTATGRVELIPGEQLRRYQDELTVARGTMSSKHPATDSQ